MAQQQSLVDESYERLRETLESVNDELESVQKRFERQRKRFERDARKRLGTLRKEFRRSPIGKRAQKLQREVEKSELVQRAQKLRKQAGKRFESVIDDFLSALPIATRSDLQKLDRKLNQINRKLNELEGARAKRSATSRAPRSAATQ